MLSAIMSQCKAFRSCGQLQVATLLPDDKRGQASLSLSSPFPSFIPRIQALWVLSQDHSEQITREQGWWDWSLSIVTYVWVILIILSFSYGSGSVKGCVEGCGGTFVSNKMSLVLTAVLGTINHRRLETLLSASEIPSSFWLYVLHSLSFVKWGKI